MPSSLNLFDGAWHSLVLTVSRSTFNAYIDKMASGIKYVNGTVFFTKFLFSGFSGYRELQRLAGGPDTSIFV